MKTLKHAILLLFLGLMSVSCNGQKNKNSKNNSPNEKVDKLTKAPKGSWKVDKKFDENGNLIRYDSIYSWSSDKEINNLTPFSKDSILKSFESKFYKDYAHLGKEGFEDVFTNDSLFGKHFFNDDFFNNEFGKEFMNLDEIKKRMLERQKSFLKKYQSAFKERNK